MANKVSFIIQLKDKFSRVSEKIERQFQSVEKSAKKANRQLAIFAKRGENIRKVAGKVAKAGAVMTAAITIPLALITKSMVNAASDATETANKFNSVFDDVRSNANQVADEFARSFGTAGSTARKLIGDTGDLLVGFGFSGKAALDLSTQVNKLAADLTSFQNVEGGVSSASAALTKALLGETESAKSLGIVIRQGDKSFRQQVRLIMAVKKVTHQQAKAIAILNQAQQQSSKAIGDVSRTWEDYASVIRRNQEATKEMSESFGMLLIPLATKLTNTLTKVVNVLNLLSPRTKQLVLVFAGLAAIAGPLLVLFAGIAAAMTFITAPMLAIAGTIGLVTAAIVLLALNWEEVVGGAKALWGDFSNFIVTKVSNIAAVMSGLWEDMKHPMISFVNLGIKLLNSMISPITFIAEKLGFSDFKLPEINNSQIVNQSANVQAPNAPVSNAGGTVNGQIVVSAQKGTSIKESILKTSSPSLNIGMNMVNQ